MPQHKFSFWMRYGCLALIVGAVLLFFNHPAVAASYGGVSISAGPPIEASPAGSRIKYILSEGEQVSDTVEISNSKAEAVTVFLFSSGFIIENGAIKRIEPDVASQGDPGYWITFSKQEVVVRPNAAVRVGFTITAPDNADVGEHAGAILIAEKKVAAQGKGGTSMQINTQIGLRLLVRVPGDVERDLRIEKMRHAIATYPTRSLKFIFDLTNRGNILLGPTLDIKMRGLFGQVGETTGMGTELVGRDQTVTVSKDWIRRAPYFGRFVADFNFHLGEYEQINKDRTTTLLPDKVIPVRYVFWIIPWLEVIYFLVFVLVLYLLRSVWLYLVIMQRLKIKTKIHKVVAGDTLVRIATKYGVDSGVLAKFNLLRWPYDLRVGDELLIPTGRLSRLEWHSEYTGMLDRKAMLSGVLSHWFSRRNVYHMTRQFSQRFSSPVAPTTPKVETVVVESGDTIKDVATFAHTTVAEIARLNRLKSPYRLRAGQELLIPQSKSKSTRSTKNRRR